MIDETVLFTTSIDLSNHPMINAKIKLKKQYYLVLKYFVKKQLDNKYTNSRLIQYKEKFFNRIEIMEEESQIKNIIKALINSRFKPWKKKYKYWIMCDVALILMNDELIDKTALEMKKYMSQRQQKQFDILLNALKDNNVDISSIIFAEELMTQYRENRRFKEIKMHKYIVTANMSAGKSTLINALVGKPLLKMSQEVCIDFTNNATEKDLRNISWKTKTSIASYFRGIDDIKSHICIIDTPGVNYVLNQKHGKISQEILQQEEYEKIIYILNANKLGTDEEINYLKRISENVSKEKAIFVLNKLDEFRIAYDDIFMSINNVKKDLITMGFENPVICPISAYFALLIKMKANGYELTDDEIDEYLFYIKKFRKKEYDFSKYYQGVYLEDGDNEIVEMSKKCGLYGLEKMLLGGII